MTITALDLAQRFIGIREIAGQQNHPLVSWWLSLCGFDLTTPDEVAWCSAFINGIAWELRLPRSKSAAARSWLTVGTGVGIGEAIPGFDVVILKRGEGAQPGPKVLAAPGHVTFFAGWQADRILGTGGNQSNGVTTESFDVDRILGIRRLA